MKKNVAISLLLGILVSVSALYFSFRNVPLKALVSYIASVNYLWIFPAVGVSLFTFVLRAVRWRVILASSCKIGFLDAFHPLMIGFMINCILPGRVGEVARPIILKKREHVPFSTGLATVAVERAFDVGFIIVFFIAVLIFVDIDPEIDMSFGKYHLNRATLITIGEGMLMLSIALIAGIMMISIDRTRKWITLSISRFPSLFFFTSRGIRDRITSVISIPVVGIVDNFAVGFSLVKSPEKLSLCMGLSFLIWILSALSYYAMARGCPGVTLSFLEIAAVMIIICFFIALPSVPGFWGIWEAGGIFALSLFGVSGQDAAGYTLVNHGVQMIPVMIVGLVSALIIGINILQVSYEKG